MTEADWLACADPTPMLHHAYQAHRSDRKLRLFGCACCRRINPLLSHDWARESVRVAEAYADGLASYSELQAANNRAHNGRQAIGLVSEQEAIAAAAVGEHVPLGAISAATEVSAGLAFHAAAQSAGCSAYAVRERRDHYPESRDASELAIQAALLREIFGNPFRPVAFDPAWLTSDVMLLAKGIYAERAFERLPILADALQDAGCDSDDLLAHLRDPAATHVRGCWALDLVLGKE